MSLRPALLAFLACLVAACGQPDGRENGGAETANPLLWEVARVDGGDDAGQVEGWLLGTIHALPDDVKWRGGAVDDVVAQADVLAVEIAELDDGHAMAAAFLPLATSAGLPPLTARVAQDQRAQLTELVDDSSYSLRDFARIESWGAALMLAQAVRTRADPANGVDRALIEEFSDREVIELEGAKAQFAAFDGLSQNAQRTMLSSIVEESQSDPDVLARPIDLYLAGDVAGLERLSHEGMLADPEIRTALLTRRNAEWLAKIEPLLRRGERPLIAVGAAHMLGEDGLVALLEARGYRVTRLN
ncbi:TraB/GumN family protein [Alteriqipengyuania lutimaris]|uniref:TraB/GumN family protein n=2 Tax=Alteriqipengyuania lutimaris TaxID=1538146 RepID=A0A395LP19_9SPHN|nr:TraB/GumN family protein [Alteriqipengyuania lutimaris]RDS78652.1 TraB/GumN family protein [Alteriqipengyuania lutimaris]